MTSKPWRWYEAEETPEGTTIVVEGTIIDTAGLALGLAELDMIHATLYDRDRPDQVVDGWDQLNVKGMNGGSFDPTTKAFSLRIPPESNLIAGESRPLETRVLLLEWTYNAGADAGVREVEYPLRNLPHRSSGVS